MRRQERDWEELVTCPRCGEEEGVVVAIEPTTDEPGFGVVGSPCGCTLTEAERDAACYAALAALDERAWASAGD